MGFYYALFDRIMRCRVRRLNSSAELPYLVSNVPGTVFLCL
uniref:Uncharacterized protein n=1 Tax=virus sp. ctoYX9 TaxID=2825822 RepID=A0A8S5RNY1_9VIRU|nr:MAG TPA: hypothetical protein [virus sp. ctoYX9]